MAFRIAYSGSDLQKNIDNFAVKLGVVVLMFATTKAVELQGKMKVNRPWVDRTGMAKATLNAKVSQPESSKIRITLAHGVDYGIWLELAKEKKYAVIVPTMQQEGPRLVGGLESLIAKLKL